MILRQQLFFFLLLIAPAVLRASTPHSGINPPGDTPESTVSQATAVCKNATVFLDENGMVTLHPDDVDGGSVYSPQSGSMSVSIVQMDCSNLGLNPVTLSVSDGSGNVATCQASTC